MTTKAWLPVALILSLSGAACTRSGDAPKAEPVALNVTHWTEKTELYMETRRSSPDNRRGLPCT